MHESRVLSSPDAFGCAVPPVQSEFGSIQRHSCWSVMWSTTVLMVNTLTMLTIAHADRGKPTLKDDERFRNGLVSDLDNRTLMFTR